MFTQWLFGLIYICIAFFCIGAFVSMFVWWKENQDGVDKKVLLKECQDCVEGLFIAWVLTLEVYTLCCLLAWLIGAQV